MTEVLEILSDSDDTIINPIDHFSDECGPDIKSIVDKYISENCSGEGDENKYSSYEEDNVNDHEDYFSVKEVKEAESVSVNSSSQEEIETLHKLIEKYNEINEKFDKNDKYVSDTNSVSKIRNLKEFRKSEQEIKKQENSKGRVLKKMQLQQEKMLKQAVMAAHKNIKPTECMKFITVILDNNITTQMYGADIINALQGVNVQFKIESPIVKNTITWTRKAESHLMDDSGNLVLSCDYKEADEILLIMNCREFVEQVKNATLCTHIQSLKFVQDNKKITLVIYGLQTYKRFQKNQKQKEIREQITGDERHTSNRFFKDFPKVSNENIEDALTELQLLCCISHRLIDSGQELGQLVLQFTKAVAEIPYKLQKYEKFQKTDWFISGDNRNCVKVDKNGNGLNRLWNQMLTMFPLARLETADAISLKYPTISALMKAYDNCTSIKEGETLLQDIPIRRAAGPLSSSRKIGSELSKRVYNFFTSLDGESLL